MKFKLKKLFSNFYNIYLVGLSILITLPVIAPILLKLGLEAPAKVIYFVYSFFCHQFAYRSIHLFDYQLAWCARDTGIWIGIFTVAVLVKLNRIKGIKWYWVIPFLVPIALDGGLQTIFTILNVSAAGNLIGLPLYISTNLTRFMTGSIFGIGLSLWLSPMIKEDPAEVKTEAEISKMRLEEYAKLAPLTLKSRVMKFLQSNLGKILVLCVLMFPLYVVLFGLWDLTSTINKPLEPLDAVVKAPATDFLTRRADGPCPTNGFQNFFALDCFLH